jgi:NDP-sugar pyrophosphorylase family protein
MIGVIVVPGPSLRMHGLDTERPASLLPLGDRPVLQHIIELLVAQGVISIEFIVSHAPERIEALFGNGDRWGCSFRYHLAAQPERPYRSLKIISAAKTKPWVLIHAERYPCIELASTSVTEVVLYHGDFPCDSSDQNEASIGNQQHSWGGTAVFPAGLLTEVFVNQTREELCLHLQDLVSNASATVIAAPDWIDASTPAALLETQAKLLSRRLNDLMISGTERKPGIWFSRNVVVHPMVELIAPLYIGPNCRLNRGVKLGPNTVIHGDCIVDTNTIIEHSLITAGSYIGEGLELSNSVVDHNLLVNVRLDASVDILESFLLGRLKQQRRGNWFARIVQAILALLLIVLFLPISFLSLLYFAVVQRRFYTSAQMVEIPTEEKTLTSSNYSLLCLGADAWGVRRMAGWGAFLRQFLPGLFSVFTGRLSLVGLPPKTLREIQHLPVEWRSMYLEGRAGLITEASLASADTDDEMQHYLADAYYSVKRSWSHDFKLAFQYMLRLIVPARK